MNVSLFVMILNINYSIDHHDILHTLYHLMINKTIVVFDIIQNLVIYIY